MTKIRTIEQLRTERTRLHKRQKELEERMGAEWKDFRQQFGPRYQASGFFSRLFQRKKRDFNGHDFLANTLAGFAARFARKLTEDAEERIRRWWRKAG